MMAALAPAALARPVPLPWGGMMLLGEFLERYPVEILVHAALLTSNCQFPNFPKNADGRTPQALERSRLGPV